MAKRGYRGKHPHNDMKVSKHSRSSNKTNPKLRKEYDRLKPKQKYSYIRTQQGFFPEAKMVISGAVDMVAGNQITMSNHTGQILQISGADADSTALGFKTNGNALVTGQGIANAVNTAFAGSILATTSSVAGGNAAANDTIITLVASAPGPDSNTEVVISNGGKMPASVTFNGVGANNSGSGLFFTGG